VNWTDRRYKLQPALYRRKKYLMLDLLPLKGFLFAAVCLHSIQFSKGEVSLKEGDICNNEIRIKIIRQ
jgi:hypothetical protein